MPPPVATTVLEAVTWGPTVLSTVGWAGLVELGEVVWEPRELDAVSWPSGQRADALAGLRFNEWGEVVVRVPPQPAPVDDEVEREAA